MCCVENMMEKVGHVTNARNINPYLNAMIIREIWFDELTFVNKYGAVINYPTNDCNCKWKRREKYARPSKLERNHFDRFGVNRKFTDQANQWFARFVIDPQTSIYQSERVAERMNERADLSERPDRARSKTWKRRSLRFIEQIPVPWSPTQTLPLFSLGKQR